MKVVLAGASGSGKTTLAKALAEHFGWYFTENSAGLIMTRKHKTDLKEMFGYEGGWGQRKVINQSHADPSFGRAFQGSVLSARYLLMANNADKDCIFDRSTLDPIVFYLNQVVHNDEEQDDSQHFIHRCISGLREVDMILKIPLQNPECKIEDNGSRVANWYFQKKIDMLFDVAMNLVISENNKHKYLMGPKKIMIAAAPAWDWQTRLDWGIQMINKLKSGSF